MDYRSIWDTAAPKNAFPALVSITGVKSTYRKYALFIRLKGPLREPLLLILIAFAFALLRRVGSPSDKGTSQHLSAPTLSFAGLTRVNS